MQTSVSERILPRRVRSLSSDTLLLLFAVHVLKVLNNFPISWPVLISAVNAESANLRVDFSFPTCNSAG
jgi:hypothetical protein